MANTAINQSNIRELPRPCFVDWLVREDEVSIEGCSVECFRLKGAIDDAALVEWARHIRRHYIRDDELREYSEFFEIGENEYLRENVIPDVPQIMAGDFAEIVISSWRGMKFLATSSMAGQTRIVPSTAPISLPSRWKIRRTHPSSISCSQLKSNPGAVAQISKAPFQMQQKTPLKIGAELQ